MGGWIFKTVFCGAALSGCRGEATKTPADALVIGIENEIKNLDVRYAADANTGHIAALLAQSLIRVGDDFQLEPDLAESFTNERSQRFTFRIPEGVTFHDGAPLSSADVLYSFNQAAGPSSRVRSSFADVKSFEAPDPRTFVVTLKAPNAAFLTSELSAIRIFPAHLAEKDTFPRNPVGSGPYRFSSRSQRDLVFERFDNYRSWATARGGEPRPFRRIIVRAVEDPTTRFLSLVGGDIDALFNALGPRRLVEAAQLPQLRIQRTAGTSIQYLGLNLKLPKFRDPRVRLALLHAIDRDALIRYKLKGYARRAENLLPPENPWAGESIPVGYDPGRARALLAAAGAKSLEIEIKSSTDRDSISMLQVIQKNWQDVGVKVTIRSAEFATFFAQVREGNFEAFSLRFTSVIDPDLLYKTFHSRELPPGRNRGGYSNAQVDRLLDSARREPDPARRRQLYVDAQKILTVDRPILPLWYPDNVAVLSSEIENFRLSPSGSWRGIFSARKRRQP